MNWLDTWLSPGAPAPGGTLGPLSAQAPAQLARTVQALVRDVTDPDSGVSAAELVSEARFEDGLLHVYLKAPACGLGHIRELSNQIRDRLADLPEVRRVTVEVVLAVH